MVCTDVTRPRFPWSSCMAVYRSSKLTVPGTTSKSGASPNLIIKVGVSAMELCARLTHTYASV